MSFRITGLPAALFRPLYGLSDAALLARGVRRCVADRQPGFPDRIELRDAAPGETLLLLNFMHQPAANPYRASHAIFVSEGAECTWDRIDEVPALLRSRLLSVRAFDADDLMIDADVVDGAALETLIERSFADRRAAYLHLHYARRGCYAARVERA